jgi:hypothetical protein
LCQFNLELTLVSLGPEGENIQNQSRPVDHPTANYFFKIALLNRRDRLVYNNQVCGVRRDGFCDLLRFPTSHISSRLWGPSRGANAGHDPAAGRRRQTSQLIKVVINDTAVKALVYQDSTFRVIEMRGYVVGTCQKRAR